MKKYNVKYIEHKPFADSRPEIEIMTQQELVKLLTSGRIIELISVECME